MAFHKVYILFIFIYFIEKSFYIYLMEHLLDWETFNESYNKPRAGGKRRWSVKYKKKINCNNPKGFSQKQYCKRKRRGGGYKS
jgi:hypothetical protein